MAQNQHTDFLPNGRRERDMSFYEKINMAFIKIRITKSFDSKFTEVEKENSSEF
jgi:hypothetical protein